ncbi:MAG: hypothetical protein DRP42_02205 [Tenericutes bacterium]|nr:MAG: hypothetical protein DRP42_02205 [Mycoplasmatota bacterium]
MICIDLDGTFLKEPKEGIAHFEDIHEGNVKVIKELKEKGHEIAIITGRP